MDVNKKLKELFQESESEKDFRETVLRGSNLHMEDLTDEEVEEVRQALEAKKERLPQEPQRKWKWTFSGRVLFKVILLVVEFLLLNIFVGLVYITSINTNIPFTQGMTQVLAISAFLTFFRKWFK